jgi:hypothetical protein
MEDSERVHDLTVRAPTPTIGVLDIHYQVDCKCGYEQEFLGATQAGKKDILLFGCPRCGRQYNRGFEVKVTPDGLEATFTEPTWNPRERKPVEAA